MNKISSTRNTINVWCTGSLIALSSCNYAPSKVSPVNTGSWVATAGFQGAPRSGAYEFTIGNKAYVGLGFGGPTHNSYLLDSWTFSADSGTWKQVAPFPGVGREMSVSFSMGNKGYLGTGFNRNITNIDSVVLDDFWQFDPAGQTRVNGILFSGAWSRLQNFPGHARYDAVAFVSGSNAYVGAGYHGTYYSDCWEYVPLTDTWTEVTNLPGSQREGPMVLNLNANIYFFGGANQGMYNLDFWELPVGLPGALEWKLLTEPETNVNYGTFKAAVSRSQASAFTLNNLGYVVGGTGDGQDASTYQFDPIAQAWTKMASLPGSTSTPLISFSLGGRAFVTTCASGTNMWEFKPN